MRNYVQPGDSITLTAAAAATSDEGVLVNSLFGIASGDAAIGESLVLTTKASSPCPSHTSRRASAQEPFGHRKTIRKDVLEGAFKALIKQMRPSAGLMSAVAAMLRDIWDHRLQGFEQKRSDQKRALTGIDSTISKLTDRLIETTSPSAIQVYEVKLEKLEAEKALITENITQKQNVGQSFDESFRTAIKFLANPWNLWSSPNPNTRKTLLKLVFCSPIAICAKSRVSNRKNHKPFQGLRCFGR